MKKTISILLSILLLISIVGCESSGKGTRNDGLTTTATQPTEKPQTVTDITDESDSRTTQYSVIPGEFNKCPTIEETVLVDENGIKITATDLTYGQDMAELALIIENNTDEALTIKSGYDSCNSVNGYAVFLDYLKSDVAAGKEAKESIFIQYDALMFLGIFEIADIEIGFDIWDEEYNCTHTGPRSILTTVAADYDYTTPTYRESIVSKESQAENNYTLPYFSTDTVYKKNGLEIVSQAIMKKGNDKTSLYLEVLNNSNAVVEATIRNVDVNGLRIHKSALDSCLLYPGKTAVMTVDFASTFLDGLWEFYGVTEIGKVELEVSFTDEKNQEVSDPAFLSIEIPGTNASSSMDGTEVYNGNGLRIIFKGICADPSEYSDSVHILLLAESISDQAMRIESVNDSLYINGVATYFVYSFSETIAEGAIVPFEVFLYENDLKDIGITEASQIESAEFSFSIKDQDYGMIEEATLNISVE